MRNAYILGLLMLVAVLGLGCKRDLKNPDEEERYTGPTIENHDVTTLYSDSAKVLIKLQAPVQQEFEGGDGVFPKGFYIEFYDEQGKLESTLKGNYGRQETRKSLYYARGNVVVNNLKKNEKLETEELYWNRNKGRIYTDKFVKVTSPEEVITGVGLTANQDMSRYSIKKVTGKFNFSEE
ncbi:LPS export ABC transporter periplasmic protein LptC [Pontibacter mangrovi]|uniref:LPS export ABC transporter periplasmic protein LptC n=1 Tax=Pontibacter mangrovi TaxID=2589816 RepID=A0A501WF46_9BACT|nr:LPS export ABC transporter periplasmic protein LptC [Pontibacter mangrovi]TPE45597.1 LPS export ABC transporter periplasmic protein LptC [Pontibacter mangrovi]